MAKPIVRDGGPAPIPPQGGAAPTSTEGHDDAPRRLEVLLDLSGQIATSVNMARCVLKDNAEDASAAYLVADVLGRVGWLVDQVSLIAGGTCGNQANGDAFDWMIDGDSKLADEVRALAGGRGHA